MGHQKVSFLCAIDLSAAFDTVYHDIFLAVLRSRFGIHGTSLEWFDSYLRPRNLQVCIRESLMIMS
jgi:hypothetical protein